MAFCSRCKVSLSHHIAKGKESTDAFRQYEVVEKISEVKYKCVCKKCKYEWVSSSKEAKKLYKRK